MLGKISLLIPPPFLRSLKQNVDELVIKEEQELKINPLLISKSGEYITLIVIEYPTEATTEKETHHIKAILISGPWQLL